MHTCPPPEETISEWLEDHQTANGPFGHMLLLNKGGDTDEIIKGLRPYFESAHLDARTKFHEYIGISLHPDGTASGEPEITYPNCLPIKTLKGLFGEVLAGLICEHFELVGGHTWSVPIFLFRYHDDARNYLFKLARNPAKKREVVGRLGSDFIGLAFDSAGAVIRVISGEAKWRKTLHKSVVDRIMHGELVEDPPGSKKKKHRGDGVWHGLNTDPPIPIGLRQICDLLRENDPVSHDAAILSLEKSLVLHNPQPLPKTDLVVIVGNGTPTRDEMECNLPHDKKPAIYTAGNNLQLVEVVLKDGEVLVEKLYQSLWVEEADDA